MEYAFSSYKIFWHNLLSLAWISTSLFSLFSGLIFSSSLTSFERNFFSIILISSLLISLSFTIGCVISALRKRSGKFRTEYPLHEKSLKYILQQFDLKSSDDVWNACYQLDSDLKATFVRALCQNTDSWALQLIKNMSE